MTRNIKKTGERDIQQSNYMICRRNEQTDNRKRLKKLHVQRNDKDRREIHVDGCESPPKKPYEIKQKRAHEESNNQPSNTQASEQINNQTTQKRNGKIHLMNHTIRPSAVTPKTGILSFSSSTCVEAYSSFPSRF